MTALDDVFLFFQPPPHTGTMYATLTGTEQVPPTLPAGIFTASGAPVTYGPGPTPTISFHVTRYCKTPSGPPPPPFLVTLTQHPGPVYSMDVPFIGFSCPHVTVDAMSGVTYGSQGAQFVTLVLKPGQQG